MIRLDLKSAYLIMIAVVALSNYLVQFPINDWLTWGAFPYPLSYLITELTNRFYGPRKARQVVYAGFIMAAAISLPIAPIRIVIASIIAFLLSQLLDIAVFNRLRTGTWWKAPLFASLCASLVDTSLFWGIAFGGEPLPFVTWALGDFCIKFTMDVLLLSPFRLAIRKVSYKAT